uniref:Uncharacterized protein n=1 Tax=viral metagenome TaxID=1070528 RepID=A0A6C0DD06_9ZZZZ
MAFYNDRSFQCMISLLVIFGFGFVVLWFVSKIIYALFCFDIRKIHNDNTNFTNGIIDTDNHTNILDSIIQVNNPFQDTLEVSVEPQQSINNDNDSVGNIPIA